MFNPVLLTQMMRNPQAFMQQIMNNNQILQNPIGKNAIELARKGDIQGLNSLAEKNLNYLLTSLTANCQLPKFP